MRPAVFVTDMVFPDFATERAVLEPLGFELVYHGELTDPAEIAERARGAAAIMTCFSRVSAEAIEGAEGCRVVGRYGVGVDNIDVAAATRRGIPVTYVPDYCVHEVSEHALALTLALLRKVAFADRGTRVGEWPAQALKPLRRISGRTFGVVGFGRIARATAAKAAAFGMEVVAYDPFVPDDAVVAAGARPMSSLDELLETADVVSLHVPMTAENRHLIGAEQLARMRADAVLVNTARGGLVDTTAVVAALHAGEIAGAGLDVLEAEPPVGDEGLTGAPNLIVTPHVAFYSEESLVDLKRMAAEAVGAVLTGRRPAAMANEAALAAAGHA
jgi:D-3-phosphoglycerate dehydrogenase